MIFPDSSSATAVRWASALKTKQDPVTATLDFWENPIEFLMNLFNRLSNPDHTVVGQKQNKQDFAVALFAAMYNAINAPGASFKAVLQLADHQGKDHTCTVKKDAAGVSIQSENLTFSDAAAPINIKFPTNELADVNKIIETVMQKAAALVVERNMNPNATVDAHVKFADSILALADNEDFKLQTAADILVSDKPQKKDRVLWAAQYVTDNHTNFQVDTFPSGHSLNDVIKIAEATEGLAFSNFLDTVTKHLTLTQLSDRTALRTAIKSVVASSEITEKSIAILKDQAEQPLVTQKIKISATFEVTIKQETHWYYLVEKPSNDGSGSVSLHKSGSKQLPENIETAGSSTNACSGSNLTFEQISYEANCAGANHLSF